MKYTLALIVLLSACASPRPTPPWQTPLQVRAAFDIGSGTTRLTVATVDLDTQKIREVLLEASRPVAYKENLEAGQFTTAIQNQGIAALKELKAQAQALRAEAYAAVATSAFREAKNGVAFANHIHAALGIKVHIIAQTDEALLGFFGVMGLAAEKARDLVVWDIGAGSMQLTMLDTEGKPLSYGDTLASVSFKDHLVQQIQNKSDKKASPNPIRAAEAKSAIAYAKQFADMQVPTAFRTKLAQDGTTLYGIGGVHAFSLQGQVAKAGTHYSLTQLKQVLPSRLGLRDEQIASKYAATEISNLLLVAGFMESLNIERVHTLPLNLTQGLLVHSRYWPE